MGTFTSHELDFANRSSRFANYATLFAVCALGSQQYEVDRYDVTPDYARDQSTLVVTGSNSSGQFSLVHAM